MTAEQSQKKATIEQFLRDIIEPSRGRVVAVLERFGVYGAVTPDSIVQAYQKYGQEFLREFYNVYISSYETARADGADTGGSISDKGEEKEFSFSELSNIMDSASNLYNSIFNGGSSGSTPAPMPAPAPAPTPTIPMTNLKITNPLVIVGGILVFLVLVLVVVKVLKKKK